VDAREAALSRDYYLVEDEAGHRFWLFREGLYGRETTAARWFVHGLFA
jgi:protein ImuB